MRTIVHWCTALAIISFSYACKKNADKQMTQPPTVIDINLVAETSTPILKATILSLNANIGGLYSAVPVNYAKTSKSYPLIVSIHGGGQYGDGNLDLPLLLNDGIPELLDEKIFPPNFISKGVNYSFIVIAP
ncbi:MAG: hypothetical protein ABJB86_24830, partial [Bacteroidota bacterium]